MKESDTDRRPQTGWKAVVDALKAEGVPYVFGLPGDPRNLYDDLYRTEREGGPRAIGVRDERSGAFMAMAYARVSGKLAACFGSPGPGIAYLVPGVLEAFSGCTPMLVLGARASRKNYGMGAFQETDQLAMMRPITKWATTAETAERIPWTMRRAVQLATTGQPGPVYVELPDDIGQPTIEMPSYVPANTDFRPAPAADAVTAAAALIAAAERPLIITGGGSVVSGAGDAVAQLAETFGVPIQTTASGRGSVAETNPLFCGLVGLYRTTFPRRVYEAADLLITIGARMEAFAGGFLARNPAAKYVQIEIDPFEIGRNWRPDVAIQSDARLAVQALAGALANQKMERKDALATEIAEGRRAAIAGARREVEASMVDGSMPMKGEAIVSEVNRVFGENTILCKENGSQDLWAYFWPYYQVLDTGCCVPPAEQTAMGLGVIGSMAAKLAAPKRQVVCTCGDGAFQMACHELGTAVQNHLGVTCVVLDDAAFGWIQWHQLRRCEGRIVATTFDPPMDVVATAVAAGWEGVRVASPSELGPSLERALEANGRRVPFVVDVPVDQSHHHTEFERFYGYEPAAGSALT